MRVLLSSAASRDKWRTRPFNKENERECFKFVFNSMSSTFRAPLKRGDAVHEEMPCARKRFKVVHAEHSMSTLLRHNVTTAFVVLDHGGTCGLKHRVHAQDGDGRLSNDRRDPKTSHHLEAECRFF